MPSPRRMLPRSCQRRFWTPSVRIANSHVHRCHGRPFALIDRKVLGVRRKITHTHPRLPKREPRRAFRRFFLHSLRLSRAVPRGQIPNRCLIPEDFPSALSYKAESVSPVCVLSLWGKTDPGRRHSLALEVRHLRVWNARPQRTDDLTTRPLLRQRERDLFSTCSGFTRGGLGGSRETKGRSRNWIP